MFVVGFFGCSDCIVVPSTWDINIVMRSFRVGL